MTTNQQRELDDSLKNPHATQEAQILLKDTRKKDHQELSKMHRGNRFRLMLGQPLLGELRN